MTTEQKAKELIEKYSKAAFSRGASILCAIICVEEIIKMLETLNKPEYTLFIENDIYTIDNTEYDTHIHGYELLSYWEEVLTHLKH